MNAAYRHSAALSATYLVNNNIFILATERLTNVMSSLPRTKRSSGRCRRLDVHPVVREADAVHNQSECARELKPQTDEGIA